MPNPDDLYLNLGIENLAEDPVRADTPSPAAVRTTELFAPMHGSRVVASIQIPIDPMKGSSNAASSEFRVCPYSRAWTILHAISLGHHGHAHDLFHRVGRAIIFGKGGVVGLQRDFGELQHAAYRGLPA